MLFIFDMGGVVTNTALVEKDVSDMLGISLEDYYKACKGNGSTTDVAGGNLLALHSDGKINAKEFWSEFGKRTGVEVSCDWFHCLFHPTRNEGTWNLVSKLKAKGHRVVCGTNTSEGYYMSHMERGDYSAFDQTYASNFMGVSKPDPKFWEIIMACEKVKPEETVFTDDKESNIEAAAALGINAFLFTDAAELEKVFAQKGWL